MEFVQKEGYVYAILIIMEWIVQKVIIFKSIVKNSYSFVCYFKVQTKKIKFVSNGLTGGDLAGIIIGWIAAVFIILIIVKRLNTFVLS